MLTPNGRVIVRESSVQVDAITEGMYLEVRNYVVGGNETDTWTDENGDRCQRYFATARDTAPTQAEDVTDLHRFARDLQWQTGIEARITPSPDREGLHVLTIDNVDFYFSADGHGYDGWGRAVQCGK